MKRTLRFLGLVVFLATALCAQDAALVLQRSVGYGTLKNSNTLSAEKRAEVEAIEKQAQAASAAGRYGEALKFMARATAAIRNQEFTPLRALDAALVCKLDHAVLEPGKTFEVRLSQYFPLDEKPAAKLSAAIVVSSVPSEEGSKPVETAVKTVADLTPDWSTSPLAIKLTVPQLPDGAYRLAITLSSGDTAKEPPVRKFVALRLGAGLANSVQAAKARVARVRSKLAAKESLLAELPTAEYRLQLFDLADAGEVDSSRLDFPQELKDVAAALDALEAGRSSLAARRGDFRRAYLSKVDNTLQPYRVYIPNGYDGAKEFPLVIALHGMGGNENSYFDAYQRGAFKVEAEKRGYLVACPKGRLPASMYTGTAEQDVMDVIAEMRQAYKVDPQRIYLTGHSMGGYGTWSVAMNHPELFAALAPIAGGGNIAGMAKIAHIPQIVIHGDNDKTVPVERSRVMVEAAKTAKTEIKYVEVPGGSHMSVAAPAFPDIFDWFDSHKRPAASAVSAGSKAN